MRKVRVDWAFPSKRYRSQILTLREEEFTQSTRLKHLVVTEAVAA